MATASTSISQSFLSRLVTALTPASRNSQATAGKDLNSLSIPGSSVRMRNGIGKVESNCNIPVSASHNDLSRDPLNNPAGLSSRKRKREDTEKSALTSNAHAFEMQDILHLSKRSPHLNITCSPSSQPSLSPFLLSPFLPPPFSLSSANVAINDGVITAQEAPSHFGMSPASSKPSPLRRSRRLAQRRSQTPLGGRLSQAVSSWSPVSGDTSACKKIYIWSPQSCYV